MKEIFLQGLRQLGFWPIVICRLRHLEEEAAPSLSCGAFSLRCTDEEPVFRSLFSKQAPSFPVLLWRLLALPLETCPYLRLTWNLRPRRLPHVAQAILALRLQELLLDLCLSIHRRSGLLPLTGLSLVRRAIRASG